MTRVDRKVDAGGSFYRLTGEVIRSWAALELSLSGWLVHLLSVDVLRARVIWDGFGDFRGKTNLLKTLTRNFAHESLWPAATGIFADVERIAGDRYILPHAFGEVDASESRLTFHSERHDDDFLVDFEVERFVDSATLEAWLGAIEDARVRAERFREGLVGQVFEESLARRSPAAG